jgi:RTX calcium-binding nonapeptide repeat (4 copies)
VRCLVLTCVLVALWVPASAAAATVTFDWCTGRYCSTAVRVAAEPAELNRIRVTAERSAITVSDAGAPPRAGAGCSLVDPSTVRCGATGTVGVAAGDGDDRVEVTGDAPHVAGLGGGPGDDLVIGAGGNDWISGGTGTDHLLGAGGDDELSDGDATGASNGDVIDGGAGVDVVDYSWRTAPVTVRLGRDGHAGEAGENDRLIAVEGAWGGDADDILRAGDRGASPSTVADIVGDLPGLAGGRGDDVLIGGRGDDRIDASEGADRVRGGSGHDDVTLPFPSTRRGARVDCGRGFDIVAYAGPSDRLVRDCDLIYVGDDEAAFAPVAASSGWVRVREVEPRTRVTVVADGGRYDGRPIARRTFRSRPGRLHLTALGRRIARRRRAPPIRIICRAGARAPRQGFRLMARRVQ